VLDRFIQQAVMQVLQRRWDRTFSEYSYGFRAYSGASRTAFRGEAEQDSGLIPNTIPG
jgi:RNA-directed DNA polymerase